MSNEDEIGEWNGLSDEDVEWMKNNPSRPRCGASMGEVDLVAELRRVVTEMWTTPETRAAFHGAADEIEQLREELADIKDGNRIILDEKCASDEVHCGCVPVLRKALNECQDWGYLVECRDAEIERLREALDRIQEDSKDIPKFNGPMSHIHEEARAALGSGEGSGDG